jgi:hypothetical protein
MSYEKLKALVGDSEEGLGIIKTLEETASSNVKTINDLERRVTEVSDTRDKYKMGNSTVKNLLGLETINEETLKEFLDKNKGGKGGDEKLVGEINNLKDLLSKTNDEKGVMESDFNKRFDTQALDNIYLNSGATGMLSTDLSDDNKSQAKSTIMAGAILENGGIVYKKDGVTIFNEQTGKPLSLEDSKNQFKANPAFVGFMKPDVKNDGSNLNPANNGGGGNTTDNMTPDQMMAAGRK